MNSYEKVKSNLHVLDNGSNYYWTVYPITQIAVLVIKWILVCKLYIYSVNFTKSRDLGKIGINLCTAKQNMYYSIFWVCEVIARASVCGILKFTDRVIALKQIQIWWLNLWDRNLWESSGGEVLESLVSCIILCRQGKGKEKRFLVCKLHICHATNT